MSVPSHSRSRIRDLFDAVADVPTEERDAILQQLQATAEERASLRSLLAADEASVPSASPVDAQEHRHETQQLATDLKRALSNRTDPDASNTEPQIGRVVGVWRIAELIGRGGMSVVYRAERNDDQFEQTVAIKFLSGASARSVERFVEERRALAALEHPNIARLMDGGLCDGVPYLVMDYVVGVPIDQYCREHALDARGIAALMASVCDAVSYAHQVLRLHCDLKPANILVNRDGTVKLLDFGVSQLIDADGAAAQSSGLGYTPRYASPEQIARKPLSTVTDVYSLGVVFRELLGDPASRPAMGRSRLKLQQFFLYREANAIASKAAQTLPQHRYQSINGMRNDIARLLAHQPVSAFAGGPLYGLRKLIERQWPMAAALSVLIAAAVFFAYRIVDERDRALRAESLAATELARAQAAEANARIERDRAEVFGIRASEREQEAQEAKRLALQGRDRALRAERVSQAEAQRALLAEAAAQRESLNTREARDFLLSIFEHVDPNRGGAAQLSGAELLSRSRLRLAAIPPEQAELRYTLTLALASVFENLGLTSDARSLYQEVVRLDVPSARPTTAQRADALVRLALVESNRGNSATAVESAREGLRLRRELFPMGGEPIADAENTLGLVLSSRNEPQDRDEAGRLLASSLATRLTLFGERSEGVSAVLHNLGMHANRANRLADAEGHLRRSLAIKYELFGKRHPRTLTTVQQLVATLTNARRLDEAEPLIAEVYQTRLELFGPRSELTAAGANEWASTLHDMGRFAEAEARYLLAVNSPAHVVPAGTSRSLSWAIATNNLGGLYEDMGDLARAEEQYRVSLSARRAQLAADHATVARTEHNLGRLLSKRGQYTEAEALLQRSLATRKLRLGAQHFEPQDTRVALADLYLLTNRESKAREVWRDVDDKIYAARPARMIVKLAVDARLAPVSERLPIHERRIELARRMLGADSVALGRVELDLAEHLVSLGRQSDALPLASAAQRKFESKLVESAPERNRLAAVLAAAAR
jgi:eukaryotic-like serine/threonine-protein kinase